MTKSKKINARVTTEVDRKLREIVRATGSSMSDVIMKSIELYYQQGPAYSNETPYEIAKRNGLIGHLKGGPTDLSSRYKEYVGAAISSKYSEK